MDRAKRGKGLARGATAWGRRGGGSLRTARPNVTPYRWLMTAPNTALVREEFDPFTPGPGPGEVVVEIAG
ncbi:MAG: hypothetical protein WCJ30_18845, partial [Deltaproteobacteria bacterium]